jgi:hypothetical protein
LNGTYQLLSYADVHLLDGNVNRIQKNTGLLDASKGVDLEVNAEKTKCTFMSHYQNAGQIYNIKTVNKSFETVAKFRYLESTVTNQNYSHDEIKCRLNSGNACYHAVQNLFLFSHQNCKY